MVQVVVAHANRNGDSDGNCHEHVYCDHDRNRDGNSNAHAHTDTDRNGDPDSHSDRDPGTDCDRDADEHANPCRRTDNPEPVSREWQQFRGHTDHDHRGELRIGGDRPVW